MSETANLYDNVYGDFGSRAEAAVRHDAFGDDIGQSSWITAAAWLRYADQAHVREHSHVLEVGSGSGGPAVHLASAVGCRITGVDLNQQGVRNGNELAAARGLGDRVTFQAVDASKPLPFAAATFDAVLSNDAMCHISNRQDVLADWHRVLRPGGRILFTDAMVITGLVSQEELSVRSSIGSYFFLPPGENERLVALAGFTLLATEDVTSEAEVIAKQWHAARQRHRPELVTREGEANFEGLQRFLACTHRLSADRRLSRYCYLAEKAA
jgi:cyclopropane fatty-acyl-phospholipid synthase-like methyltransferase